MATTATTDDATTTAGVMHAIVTMTVARLPREVPAATRTDRHPTRSVINTPAHTVISPLPRPTRRLLRRRPFPATGHALHRAISLSESTSRRAFQSPTTLIAPTPGPATSPDRMEHRSYLPVRLMGLTSPRTGTSNPADAEGVVAGAELAVMSVSRLLRGPC